MPRLLTDTTTALTQDNLLPLALQYGGPLWAYAVSYTHLTLPTKA